MATSNSPEAPVSESLNSDESLFYELISTKKMLTHQLSLATNPSTPLYTIKTHESISRHKPSIILHAGDSKSSPVVGVVNLHSQHSKFHTIGVGDPGTILEDGGNKDGRMVWERLQRMKKWSYRWYEFEFEGQVYTWRRTEDRWPVCLKDMELRVGREEGGELVGVWRGSTRMNVKRGSFVLKRSDEGMVEYERKRFEAVVLLTGLAIIECYVRRSR
jgi:hypothetical protein